MKEIGQLLLGLWLILSGLKVIINLHFKYDDLVLAALAIVAGVFLVLRR